MFYFQLHSAYFADKWLVLKKMIKLFYTPVSLQVQKGEVNWIQMTT